VLAITASIHSLSHPKIVSDPKLYTVYIMASRSLTLYVGITSDLQRRTIQHQNHRFDGFTSKYKVERLVYYERFANVHSAIAREKQLKNWRRDKKIALIKSMNPTWLDLSEEWGKPVILKKPQFTVTDSH
jgi:putative endonuclease